MILKCTSKVVSNFWGALHFQGIFFIVFFQKVSVFSVICGIGKDLWGLGLPINLFYLPLLVFQLECMQGFYRNSCNATHSHFEPLQD